MPVLTGSLRVLTGSLRVVALPVLALLPLPVRTLTVLTLPVLALAVLTGALVPLAGALPVLAGRLALGPLSVRAGTLCGWWAVALWREALPRWRAVGTLAGRRAVTGLSGALAGRRAVTGLRGALSGWRAVSLRRPLLRCAPRILRVGLRLRRLRRVCHITIVV
ncbi:hypothetical protein SAMN05421869_10369 [Nonomuraea jiangxiensis]|uniref:Uncharacterized protein n=1 Tax=Nonomuraea jiangxiensis TaxID=633440 RepID=A0A1G8EQI8_9ACTN|nr:hypothetical protein SAMN05421869_10369 [Nonomuraea jiangxiensis]